MMEFDQRQCGSDGGAVLLKAAERGYGLISGMAGRLFDYRQAAKVDHSLHDLFARRVFSIACGYPDANDSARLAADPIHKILLDRDPVVGLDLASQPTLSRFENSLGPQTTLSSGRVIGRVDRYSLLVMLLHPLLHAGQEGALRRQLRHAQDAGQHRFKLQKPQMIQARKANIAGQHHPQNEPEHWHGAHLRGGRAAGELRRLRAHQAGEDWAHSGCFLQ
jgi:hypothetical protein